MKQDRRIKKILKALDKLPVNEAIGYLEQCKTYIFNLSKFQAP